MEAPVLSFTPSVAPSGASFYTGTTIPDFRHDLFFATLRGEHLHRAQLNASDPSQIVGHERLLEGRFGRLRDVVTDPDGSLYISTSNRDGRATPVLEEDPIIRLTPAP